MEADAPASLSMMGKVAPQSCTQRKIDGRLCRCPQLAQEYRALMSCRIAVMRLPLVTPGLVRLTSTVDGLFLAPPKRGAAVRWMLPMLSIVYS
mmetsp:Transcript_42536/g.99793  ORF Transcript_42536/g.99793 Transcript_42536/m.99793 type:complete len:93 (-) Transcript_42536:89-367(-)